MYKGEKGNICGMPEIANIELHKSKETGKYYIRYICHNWKINDLNFKAVDRKIYSYYYAAHCASVTFKDYCDKENRLIKVKSYFCSWESCRD